MIFRTKRILSLFTFICLSLIFTTPLLAQDHSENPEIEETMLEVRDAMTNTSSELLEIQRKLSSYTVEVLNTKIDRGECWDFVAAALDEADASWERPKDFGVLVDWQNEGIQNGDIILYEKVSLAAHDMSSSAYFYKHYAMVHEVIEGLKFTMAHQNYADNKTVHFTEIDFGHFQSGKITIWRPSSL